MPNLKEVKNRINSVKSTQQITKAMKMVAAAKLRKAQDKTIQMRPYSQKLSGILANVLANTERINSVYASKREVNKVMVVVVTSDRGLCGGFNSNIHKAVVSLLQNKYASQLKSGNVKLLCVGKRGRDYFTKRSYKVNADYAEIYASLTFVKVKEVAEYVMQAFVNQEVDAVDIVYNEFKNVATQVIREEQFLPIADKKVSDKDKKTNVDYIFEPNNEDIIKELIPKTLKIQLYKALLESNASEHGARMTAMDKATENAGDLLKQLILTYNRTRQAAITKEILEIVGGAEALAKA
ncbi:MAG: ATP synthase F1 subunit gamma [Bacteroidetes bacterium]|nr:MAG: ATP synthase F1 subunit gamma [Bacteroidota bacterium]